VARRGLALRSALAALALGAVWFALGCARPAVDRAGAAPPVDPFTAALAEGRAAFAGRSEPARLGASLAALRRAATLRPGDPEAELALARAEGFRALAAVTSAEQREAHEASARAAERALATLAPAFTAALRAGRPPAEAAPLAEGPAAEPLYWLALGRMGVAQATGPAAVLAVKDHLLPLMARAATLDERLERGGPLRALGAWSAMLPVAAGGGAALARRRFDRAAELFPDEPWRRVAEAGSLAVLLQDRAAFDRLLGEVLALPDPGQPGTAPELQLARRRARALLDKRASLF
jgi:hypothetical protein